MSNLTLREACITAGLVPGQVLSSQPKPTPNYAAVARTLQVAYLRPCFICDQRGICPHREPEIELALAGVDHA